MGCGCAAVTGPSDIYSNTEKYETNLPQEDKGPKNYSWRKEMESYEENLEKINSHKKVVHDSTKSAR